MSARGSASCPFRISGARYCGVPTMKPACVWPGAMRSIGRAMPKSISLALPVGSRIRFSGLMSRWSTPTAWAAASPAQSCLASRSPAE